MPKINIAQLDIDTDALTKKNAELLGQITKLKESQKGLRKETDNLNEASQGQLKTYAKTDAELKKLNNDYNQQKTILAETTTGVNNLSSALNKEITTVREAQKNNAKLVKLRNQVNVKTKEGQKAISQINAKMGRNNKLMKQNSSALEKQRMNIGNYSSALDRVVPGLSSFTGGLSNLMGGLKGSSTGLKAFRIALISTGIGAIVVALGLLVAAFSSTQGGMDKINAALAPIKGAFQGLIGVVQDLAVNIFGQLKDRFTIAANSILGGINKIRIGWNNLTGDVDEANELIEKNAAMIEESAAAQERVNSKMEDFNTILDGATERMEKAAEASSKIHDFTVRIERLQINTTLALAKSRLEYERLRGIAQDQNNSDEERVKALIAAEKEQKFIAGTAKQILNLQIRQLKLSQSQNDTDRKGEQELVDLKAKAFEADAAAQKKINSLIALRSGILKKQALAAIKATEEELANIVKQELAREELILTSQASIAEKIEIGKAILFEEELIRLEEEGASRLAIRLTELDEEERLERERIVSSIEDEKVKQRKLTILEKNFSTARQKILFEERMAKLDGFKFVAGQIANIFGRETALGKAAAIAQTTISTYQGAVAAQAAMSAIPVVGPALGIIAAGLTVAAGLKSVAKIAGIGLPKFAKGTKRVLGDGSETSDSVPALLSKNERVVDAANNRKIGFDLSNDQLATAANLYRSFKLNGGISMSNAGVIEAINKNTKMLKNKRASQTTVHVSDGLRAVNESKYLS